MFKTRGSSEGRNDVRIKKRHRSSIRKVCVLSRPQPGGRCRRIRSQSPFRQRRRPFHPRSATSGTRAAPRRRMRAFNEDGAADDGATVVDGGRATADAAGRWMTNRTTIIKARSWFITSFSLIIFPFGFLLWEKREKILRVVGPRSTLNKGIINSGKTHFKITRNLE